MKGGFAGMNRNFVFVRTKRGGIKRLKTPSGRLAHAKSAFAKASTSSNKFARKANYTVGCIETAKAKLGIAMTQIKRNADISSATKNVNQAISMMNKVAYGSRKNKRPTARLKYRVSPNYFN